MCGNALLVRAAHLDTRMSHQDRLRSCRFVCPVIEKRLGGIDVYQVSAVASQKCIGDALREDRRQGSEIRNIPTAADVRKACLYIVVVIDEVVTNRVSYERILVRHLHFLEHARLVRADRLYAHT